jgi:hypothetical protein
MELAGTSKVGTTIMRTHMRVQVPFTLATERYEVGLLVGRTSPDVGNTVNPSPNSNNNLDWLLLDTIFPTFSGATVDANREFTIDVRSKRKMEEMGSTYIFCLWHSIAAVTSGVSIFARTLVALP